jgi:myo-inositol-1(or 4)-monophosphatase
MTDISKEELDGIYLFAVGLGRQAGKMLMEAAQLRMNGGDGKNQEKEHVLKENAVDLVTETDEGKPQRRAGIRVNARCQLGSNCLTDVEAFIKTQIEKEYPSHK